MTAASMTTLSLLSRVRQELRRPKVGEIEIAEALHYLDLVAKDLERMGEAEELGALVLKASEQGLRPFVGATLCSATTTNMINHEVQHDGTPRGKIDAMSTVIQLAGAG